ncbi:MAG: sulfatase [Myxococcota bacterium]|nr:sulfatase [Myxococcota bacterium]
MRPCPVGSMLIVAVAAALPYCGCRGKGSAAAPGAADGKRAGAAPGAGGDPAWSAPVGAYEQSRGFRPDLPEGPGGAGVVSRVPARFRGAFPQFSLVNRFHFADVDHHGVVVDFGTAQRFKHTLGNWAMGWTGDEKEGGITYTWAVDDPADGSPNVNHRLYFFIERPEPIAFRMRYRTAVARTLNCNLNGKHNFRLSLRAGDWDVAEHQFPADALRDGENYLQMYQSPGPSEDRGGKRRYFKVDYVWFMRDPAGAAVRDRPPMPADMVREIAMRGESGEDETLWSLAVPLPTTVSYYIEIPAGRPGAPTDPYIGFAYGTKRPANGPASPVTLEIGVTADDGVRRVIWSRDVGADREGRWGVDAGGSLGQWAGSAVRIDLAARGRPSEGFRVVWGAPALYVSPPPDAAERPVRAPRNVVLLLVDTLRADHAEPWTTEAMRSLSAYRRGDVRTPLLRMLGEEGVVFENAIAPENWTLPVTASLLSGLYPMTHRTQREKDALSPDVTLLSEFLKRQGLRTAGFVGNGHVSKPNGFERGWDHFRNYIKENRRNRAEDIFGEALAWIRANKGSPFFAYVHTVDPHVPYDPGADYLAAYDARSYAGPVQPRDTSRLLESVKLRRMTLTDRDKERLHALYKGEVTYHDDAFKAFFEGLDAEGLLDDTLIVVTSDHGEEFFEHGKVGHGHSLFQELVHVPLLFWSRGLGRPRRVPEHVGLADVAPTIADLLGFGGAAQGAGWAVEGNSLMPLLMGQRIAGPVAAFTNHQGERIAVVSGGWKLQMNGATQSALLSIRGDDFEQAAFKEDGTFDWDALRPAIRARPITTRYLRIVMGQFLGAPDRQRWRDADVTAAGARQYAPGTAQYDAQTAARLREMGYLQ